MKREIRMIYNNMVDTYALKCFSYGMTDVLV